MPINSKAIPDMLHWYEGMLLMPEHFRAAGRRHELLGGYLAQIAMPHAWGLRALDAPPPDNGVLLIRSLEAVMTDGLLVRYDKDVDVDLELKIDLKDIKAALDEKKRQTVHLVVPAWHEQSINQEEPGAGSLTRYRSVQGARLEDDDSVETADMAAERLRERPWLRPALSLQVTDGPLDAPAAKYISIPLLRLFQNPESAVVIDRYEPPQTDIVRAIHLVECGRQIVTELRAKARFLNERLQRNTGLPNRDETAALPTIELQLRLLARRFQALQHNVENLQALARAVPRLEALTRDVGTHPYALYLALCDVVGDVALLGGDLNLPDIPAYAHADPLPAFDFLKQHIFWMLGTLNQRFRAIPFERRSAGRFELPFKSDDFGSHFIVGAVRARGAPANPVFNWMTHAAIATSELVPDLKVRRVGGAGRTQIDRDDTLDLSAPPLTTLFRVDANADNINRADGTLVIENNAPEGPTDIMLYLPLDTADADGARIAP